MAQASASVPTGERKRGRDGLTNSLEENARSILYPQWLKPNEVVYLISKTNMSKNKNKLQKDPGLLYCTNTRLVWCKTHVFHLQESFPDLTHSMLAKIEQGKAPVTNNPLLLATLKQSVSFGHNAAQIDIYTFEFLSETAASELATFATIINAFIEQSNSATSSSSSASSFSASSIHHLPSSSSSSIPLPARPLAGFLPSAPHQQNNLHHTPTSLMLPGSHPTSTLSSATSHSSSSLEVTRRRASLLASDFELRTLYHRLVEKQQVLTDDEFWESRRMYELEAEARIPFQERGAPTEPLSDIIRIESSDGSSPLTIKLTPTVISNIFKEYPHVRSMYELQVPGMIPERQFWERFIRAELLRDKSNDAHVIDPNDADGQEDGPQTDRTQLVNNALPLFLNEVGAGLGTVPEHPMRPSNLRISHSVIKKINRHGDLVLKTPTTALTKNLPTMRSTPDPLQQPPERPEPTSLALTVADRDHFFAAHASEGDADNPLAAELKRGKSMFLLAREWRVQLWEWKEPNIEELQKNQEHLSKALMIMGRDTQQRGTQFDSKFDNPEHLHTLQECHARSQELLRHFWRAWDAYPIRSAAALKKARRLLEPLRAMEKEIAELQSQYRAHRETQGFADLLPPVSQSLQKAISLLEAAPPS